MLQEREYKILCAAATKAAESKGRVNIEEDHPGEMRTAFMIDRDRILYTKAFRRLKGKTQVFIAPDNDHFMNRLIHTFEVAQISRTIARCLMLNEDLTEAIALGHDIGHTPFGHAGEEALDSALLAINKNHFKHEDASVRRLQLLEKRGDKIGLNLTREVIDGILNHSDFHFTPKASTPEGQIVMFADKIAYLTSDMGNAISAGLLPGIPEPALEIGTSKSAIINAMVMDIINNFDGQNIRMTSKMFEKTCVFRKYMFEHVYYSKMLRDQADEAKIMIKTIFDFYYRNPAFVPSDYAGDDIQGLVDYIASMTDQYAIKLYNSIKNLRGETSMLSLAKKEYLT